MTISPIPELDGRIIPAHQSRRILVQALALAAAAIAHSLYVRGWRRTLLFLIANIGLALIGEHLAVNVLRLLRHRTQPQVKGLPLGAVLGWYNISYATFAIAENVINSRNLARNTRRWLLPATTAVIATSLDLLMDCASLDQGLWEWTHGGLYAREIKGPNGKPGIPVVNFVGWFAVISGVVIVYLGISDARGEQAIHLKKPNYVFAGQCAALLLLPYYIESLIWAIRHGKIRFILYSILVPITLAAALTRKPAP